MSQMCLVGVENACRYGTGVVLDNLQLKADEHGLGIVLDPSEASYGDIMRQFDSKKSVFFCISDKRNGTTCEELFCPDWCNVHEKKLRTFSENLLIIQEIISFIPMMGGVIHLFIGMDLGLYSDYPIMQCKIEELAKIIKLETDKVGYVPDMHIIIKNL